MVSYKKKAIITGADGFIGRHLTEYLKKKDYDIYAVVYKTSYMQQIERESNGIHYISCDLNNILKYEKLFPDDIYIMFHFAWNGVKPELRENLDVQLSNIAITIKCLEFAEKKGIKRFLYPGSTNEYLYYGKPLNDDAIPSPKDAYGSVKVALKYISSQFAKKRKITFLYTVITGIYASDRRDNNVIFYTIDKLLKGEKPSLTKLEQLWDYVYVDDVVKALYLVAEHGKEDVVYAIGHGDNWSLRKYIEIIRNIINPNLPLGIGEKSYTDSKLPSSCIDLSNITRDTGFVPDVDFEDGIECVIRSIKEEKAKNGKL